MTHPPAPIEQPPPKPPPPPPTPLEIRGNEPLCRVCKGFRVYRSADWITCDRCGAKERRDDYYRRHGFRDGRMMGLLVGVAAMLMLGIVMKVLGLA